MRLMICLRRVFLLAALLFSIGAYGQNYYFKTLDREDGLSHNMVYDILQDQQGFIWAATQKGDQMQKSVFTRPVFSSV